MQEQNSHGINRAWIITICAIAISGIAVLLTPIALFVLDVLWVFRSEPNVNVITVDPNQEQERQQEEKNQW
jgi:hypothetical protein